MFLGSNFKRKTNPRSASMIWNQWHGIGIYNDIPVKGGIPEMEKLHYTRWRRGYSNAEKNQFYRLKMIIETMKEAKKGKSDDDAFFREMNEVFAINPKISSFLNTLRAAGDSS